MSLRKGIAWLRSRAVAMGRQGASGSALPGRAQAPAREEAALQQALRAARSAAMPQILHPVTNRP